MSQKYKIPEAFKKTPRCPLCYAEFARKEIPSRKAHLLQLIQEANQRLKAAQDSRKESDIKDAKEWGEALELSLKQGAAVAFFCHFCKIAIGVNDPFVGRWEEAQHGEKMPCYIHEDVPMRWFGTSTGYSLFKCPVKGCIVKMESISKDRREGEKPLYDSKGEPIKLPGVNKAIATPEDPGPLQ